MQLDGRWATCRVTERTDYEALWRVAVGSGSAWPWRGRPCGPEGFVDSLWSGALANFTIFRRGSKVPIGLVQAYAYNPQHQYCYISVYLDQSARGSGWPLEALPLFVRFLFGRHNLRKVYAEVSRPTLNRLGLIVESWATVEAVFRDHLFVDGTYVDSIVLAISRSQLDEGRVMPHHGDPLFSARVS